MSANSTSGDNTEVLLRIDGMTCGSCVARVESALRAVDGVDSASVNLATETAAVHAAKHVEAERLLRAVRNAGYDGVPVHASSAGEPDLNRRSEQRLREHRQAVVTAVGIGLPIMALHWLGHTLSSTQPGAHFWPAALQALLTTMLFASPAAGPILAGGLRALLHRSPNMDVLIALGITAAALGSLVGMFVPSLAHLDYFHDAAMILIFINVGKYLEARARTKASASLAALLRRAPRRAMRIEGTTAVEVPIDVVRTGDSLQVAAEWHVPVDGVVRSGRAAVDQSMWTGEAIPLEVETGDRVLGGSYVHSGMIVIEATAVGQDSAIARIVRLVQDAQTGKTKMQRIADRIAGVFVPVAILAAALTAAGWMLAGGPDAISRAIAAMVAVLVVACPCAMGLATPTAVLVATGAAALRGIIVRDAAALEQAGRAQVVLLDKTGTLTSGRPEVARIITAQGGAAERVLRYAASAEQFSAHPLARAIVRHAGRQGLALSSPTAYAAEAGLGVTATIGGHKILVGSERHLERNGLASPPAASAGTLAHVACDGEYLGSIEIADAIRPGAAATVARLKHMGVPPVRVTGDSRAAAEAVASVLGIDETVAGVTPAGKSELVQARREDGRTCVIMVGDGINDAPALAAADVGIAMAGGTEVASETADIALVGDRIELLPDAIDLARRSARIIRQNLLWAFAYNVVAIPLAAFGILPAGYAAAAMMCSSITVVLNALRLQHAVPSAKEAHNSGAQPISSHTSDSQGHLVH